MVALGQGMGRRKGRNGIEEKNIVKNILFFYSRKKTGSKDIKMLIFLEFMVIHESYFSQYFSEFKHF